MSDDVTASAATVPAATLQETWRIHDRIHRYLLDALPELSLDVSLSPKSRTVRALFVHVHNVRKMWLDASSPELSASVEKLDTKALYDRAAISHALSLSGAAIESLLAVGFATGRIKNFKPHPAAFLGYLIAYESHHRGQIEWALRFSGCALDDKTAYGIWEWGVR